MRYSPTKLLHGLLYMTPVALLALAACGGGGGSTSSAPLAGAYTLSVNVTGVSGVGVVLRNNGGDDLAVTTPGTYDFATQVLSATGYNVTVLSHPSAPVQLCTVGTVAIPSTGTMPAYNLTVNVDCVNAYTIGGNISGDASLGAGIGPILRNNGGDDLFIATLPAAGSSVPFTFTTPVASGSTYTVTQLSKARSPGQDCSNITPVSGVVSTANIIDVTIICVSQPIVPHFAYVANSTANTVSAYAIDSVTGALSPVNSPSTGTEPLSVTVDPSGRFAYVANSKSNTISAYSINIPSGALTEIDQNGALAGTTVATGAGPAFITIHPLGKFAYVVNLVGDTISAYSINTTSGALSAIDANGALAGTTIATGMQPSEVIVDPTGQFAYVANYGDNINPGSVSVYSINQTSGALTAGTEVQAGLGASSIAIDPYGKFLLVANNTSNNVTFYTISNGALTTKTTTSVAGSNPNPRSIAIDPKTGVYAYVANAGGGVSAYTINPTTGVLTEMASSPFAAGTLPFSVNVDPSGYFVYVANLGSNDVSVYSIDAGGALTQVACGPAGPPCDAAGNNFLAGAGPFSVTTTQ